MPDMTKQEKSWVLYDVANSAFVLIIITTIMPIFFKDVASRGADSAVSTANWAFANSFASLVLALLAPVIGAVADYENLKKKFLVFFLGLGILATLALTTVSEGEWLRCLLIFVFARIGFAGANIFYDAFLVDITVKERMNRISTAGYAYGYIGSVIPFLMVIGLILLGTPPGASAGISVSAARAAFVIVALWWLLFSVPLLKNVRQKYYMPPAKHPVRDSFARLAGTFKEIRKYRQVFLFLMAYFLYIDGVDTIITMSAAYGRDIGLGVTALILAILMIQIVAFPFALLYGNLADRFSEKTMLFVGIAVYSFITLVSFFLPDLPTKEMKVIVFWILAFFVASSLGGIQALSRSFFGRLIPAERSAEFFGFYNIFGKFAAITGPFLMGVISHITGHSRYGVLSLLILFIAGGIILSKVGRENQ
ncbi:MFS transporter [Desulfonema magnum]|uniref:Autophagy domain-containing protein n=1 Tax=Desulfonema magnum TaxID=45655 RepID=A0A975GPG2_9BACT|nr:MFS transporter [Desulfonema magnum]QTA88770.1 Autophagy domain-containing protein [Desulfonema magnum]